MTRILARKRPGPWQPLPTVTIRCGAYIPIVKGDFEPQVECTAKNLHDAAKRLSVRMNQVMPEPTPGNLKRALNDMADRYNKRWGGSHEHADFIPKGGYAKDDLKFLAWLKNPRRHEHGFSTPGVAVPGYTPGPLAHDDFGAGLIGQEQHRTSSANPFRINGKWSSHFGDWDRAVRAWEDAA